jgi:hypothetical protein
VKLTAGDKKRLQATTYLCKHDMAQLHEKPVLTPEELIAKGICPVKPEYIRKISKVVQVAVTGEGQGTNGKSKSKIKKVTEKECWASLRRQLISMATSLRSAKKTRSKSCVSPTYQVPAGTERIAASIMMYTRLQGRSQKTCLGAAPL